MTRRFWSACLLMLVLLTACGVETERGVTLAAPDSTLQPTPLPPTPTPTRASRATPIATPTLSPAAVIDAATAADMVEIATWRAPIGPLLRLAFSPDGHTLAASTLDGRVLLWAVGGADDPLVLGEAPTQGVVSVSGASTSPWGALVFPPDGATLLTVRSPGTVTAWDVASGAARGEFSLTRANQVALGALAFSADGRYLARGLPDLLDGGYEVWDVDGGQRIGRWVAQNGGLISVAAFSPDGRLLATSGVDHHLVVWDFASGTPLSDVSAASRRPTQIAFDPTGSIVAVVSADGTLDAWPIAAGGEGITLGDPVTFSQADGFDGLAFSPAADLLALIQRNGTLQLWAIRHMVGGRLQLDDAGRFTPETLPAASDSQASTWASLAISPDGTRLATTSPGGGIHLWARPEPQ